jgi:hypothetical protein
MGIGKGSGEERMAMTQHKKKFIDHPKRLGL